MNKYKLNIVITLLMSFTVLNALSEAQTLSGAEVKRTYYPNGNIKTEGEYWYDRLDGIYKEFYPNSKLWKEWHFKDGKEDGLSGFPHGILRMEF
jgi:hypothetical protein